MMNITSQEQTAISLRSVSLPKLLLSVEGITIFASAVALYIHEGYGLLTFVALLLLPDLTFVGYAAGPKIGSSLYNLIHTFSLPVTLTVLALLLDWSTGVQLGLIWTAHIGLDRTVGYGLKYATGSKDTHLQRV